MNNPLSSHIDPDKIFIINHSEIEGRWDPSVYKNAFIFASKIYPKYKLSEVALINPNTSFRDLDDNSEITFIPMDAIDETNGIVTKTYYRKVLEYKGYTKFKEGDLIWAKITPCMQNGNSAIIRNAKQGYGFGSTEFFVIRPKNDNVLIDYIYILLRDQRVLNNAMNYFGGSAGQQRVPKEFLINFRLPLPPIDIQRKVINLYSDAWARKQQKEAQATALLASIDDYLLGELGITLPEQNNSLQNRIFTTQFSEVVGNRIDPNYRMKITSLIEQKGNYKFISLKDLLSKPPQYGANEEAQDGNEHTDIRYIRITDIDEYGNLKQENWKTAANTEEKYLLNQNDLLFARSGSVGRCYIHKEIGKKAIFAGYLIRFIVDTNFVIPDYIFHYCNSAIYKFWVDAIHRPAVQSNINSEEYQSLPIPLPPLEKQNEIAQHIQSIRNQARSLQKEAQEILEKAKKEVEQIILGE